MLYIYLFFPQFFPGSPSQDLLDYGTLGMGERRDLFFTVVNRNPVTVTLRGWGSNLTGSLVEMMGVAEGNETQILRRTNFSEGLTRRLLIPPGKKEKYILKKDGNSNVAYF